MHFLKQMIPHWVKVPLKRLYYQATFHGDNLPDFIIIGSQKSGTTSLYYYLIQHSQLLPSRIKEIHFFDDYFELGTAWYRAQFRSPNLFLNLKLFEATPRYLFHPLAPKRIVTVLPNLKMIVLLRNPTDRAISHYFMSKRYNNEELSLKEALLAEEKRLKPIIQKQDYNNPIFKMNSYKSRGLYKEQLERYFKYFPRQHIFVINSEKFFAQPQNTLRQVFEFVEVNQEFKIQDLQPCNKGYNKSKVHPDIYEYLNSYFRPHNEALYELIGTRYDW